MKQIDPAAKTVVVGWFLGLFRTTLEVTDDTQIQGQGQKAAFMDLREGAMVKASYETRNGKNIAKSVEVMPAQPKESAPAPTGPPAGPGAPMGAPGGPGTPPAAGRSRSQ